jgi:hypothetical protein
MKRSTERGIWTVVKLLLVGAGVVWVIRNGETLLAKVFPASGEVSSTSELGIELPSGSSQFLSDLQHSLNQSFAKLEYALLNAFDATTLATILGGEAPPDRVLEIENARTQAIVQAIVSGARSNAPRYVRAEIAYPE